MSKTRPLTELEGTVLGVVWSHEPCTPYQVRSVFAESLSPYWSGSAGAIYPLLTRLEDLGLVRSTAHATGSRPSRLYKLTATGRAALRRWVGPPISEEVVGVPPDPLRTRLAFLNVLPPAKRMELVEGVEAGIAQRLERSEADYHTRREGDPHFEVMARGAVTMQKTRLKWVREVLAALRARR